MATHNLDAGPSAEIITGAGPGGGPQVNVFGTDTSHLVAFYAYDPGFGGGVHVGGAGLSP